MPDFIGASNSMLAVDNPSHIRFIINRDLVIFDPVFARLQ